VEGTANGPQPPARADEGRPSSVLLVCVVLAVAMTAGVAVGSVGYCAANGRSPSPARPKRSSHSAATASGSVRAAERSIDAVRGGRRGTYRRWPKPRECGRHRTHRPARTGGRANIRVCGMAYAGPRRARSPVWAAYEDRRWDRRGPANGLGKPTLTVRPDWLENHEQQRTRANIPENAGHRGSVFARIRGCSLVWRPQTDRSRREKGPQKDRSLPRGWMRENHGYGRESRG
jgi:hypothetical protein